MARKNSNAGQPNRQAQMYRKAERIERNTKHKGFRYTSPATNQKENNS